ncbi:uncharacterized protein PFL1_05824 [Pseudozyma flocculosa PF-1]|uniref:Uncharacterized protein n=2 Tax=Pseudozyma flocculosa TaxID=84751 RepID=A0A5C3F2I0_9BASI|nr:uncharacterized protein PFL1_05824 [Pseudozyma flocculosa PF-1]EPQ26502.1 hypothetical protein PFL1_05824 [Pseudozyma flocculosa PF-1]SPO38512.1 uncharacterized protein PSFLO_03990 [Pseudozyma flocculosa]
MPPTTPSSYEAADSTSTMSQSISDIVIDTSSSADSIAVARRPQPGFLFPAAPPRTSSHASPVAPPRVAPRLLDPFTTPEGMLAGPSSYLQRAPVGHVPAQAGPSRYGIPPSSFSSSSSPFSAPGVGHVGPRQQGITLLTTPSAPTSFPVHTTASTTAGARGPPAMPQPQQLPALPPPPAAPRRPVAAANPREQYASTPESSFDGSSWFGRGRGPGMLGHGYGLPSLDAAAQAEERRAQRAELASSPFGFQRREDAIPAGDEGNDAAVQRRRVTFFPPAPPAFAQGQGQGHGPPPAFETPTNIGMGIDERGVAFAQTRPTAADASLSINTSSSYLTGTGASTTDGGTETVGESRGQDDEAEVGDDGDGPPSPPPLVLRTWKGETMPVPAYLIEPDIEAMARSSAATQGVLATFLGLRAFHGWYGHSYRGSASPSASASADRQGSDRADESDDREADESTIHLYDAFGRVRATVSTPKYHLRGGPKRPLPPPRESLAMRKKAELRAVQRRNARSQRLDTSTTARDVDGVPATHGPGARKWKSTIRPWSSHRPAASTSLGLSQADREERKRRKVVEDTMCGLRNAVLSAEVDDWTQPHPAFQGRGTIYSADDDDDDDDDDGAGATGSLCGLPMVPPLTARTSVYRLESAQPGVYL